MNGYFDIHCHILPGVDDGADSMEETEKMLKEAYKEGIRNIIATPHYHPRRGHAPAEQILEAADRVRDMMEKKFPGMYLYQGQEIYYSHDVLDKLKSEEIFTMEESQYVLTEFSVGDGIPRIKEGLNNLLMRGYSPILAHVERYALLDKDMESIEELTEAGVYLQVNSGSFLGELGGEKKRFVKKLLKAGLVTFIASDAHDSERRTPRFRKCTEYISNKFGEETARRIFYDNPQKIIENEII